MRRGVTLERDESATGAGTSVSLSSPDASAVAMRGTGPRVLAVTSEPPWPLDSGGHLRSFFLLKALASRAELRVVCPVQPHQEAALAPLAAAGLELRPVPVPARSIAQEARRLVSAGLRGEPYVMYGRHRWQAALAAWRAARRDFQPDLLYFDHLDSWVYASLSASDRTPAVIDLHNVYSLLARRSASEQTQSWKRWWLTREARQLERIETQIAKACPTLFAVSETEASHFRRLGAPQVHAVPNGVDYASRADLPAGRWGPPTVLFLGSMGWGPNVAAVRFLAGAVWPALRERIPDVRLLIVGRNPPADVRALAGETITVTGAVPDVKPFLAQASVLAVPLDAGGGTRLKILEAFAAGLPVVSTRVGAEGLAAERDVHYVEAERPDFAGALADLLSSPARGAQMAVAARALAQASYDWQHIGERAAGHVLAAAGRGPASEILGRLPAGRGFPGTKTEP